MFERIDHVKLYVKDLEKVADFYINKLGFRVVGPSPSVMKAKRYVMLRHGEIGIDLQVPEGAESLKSQREHGFGYTHIAFKVRDVEAVYEELTRRGVEFFIKPRLNPDNGRTLAFFRDPEGNILHITD